VTVVSVADDAPYFATDDVSATIYRYVAFSNTYEVASQQGGVLTFAKLSGSLPAGLSVKYDAASKKMAVFGVPTTSDAKKGVKRYEAVYQVTEARPVAGSRSTKKVAGLTIRLTFDVIDPALAGGTGSTPLNGFFAKTRTYSDIPVVETDVGTLIGTLQVTIPQTGKASAKLLCSAGTISFSAKSFEQVQESGNFVLILNPTSKTYEGMTLGIDASPQGELDIAIVGLSGSLSAQASAPQWSSTASAKRYQGQYTIAMPVHRDEQGEEDIDEGITGLAPRGTPYLTLKMTSASQWNAGKMTWAGALANGTAISGTAVLTEKVLDDGSVAVLPIVKQSKTDFFSALPRLLPDAKAKAESQEEEECYQTIESPKLAFEKGEGGLVEVTVRPWWSHAEGTQYVPDAVYSVVYDLYGSIYDLSHGLDCCCQAYVGTTNLQLTVEMPLPSEYYGALGPVSAPMVTVTAKTVSVMKNATNPQKLTLSLNSSGVVSGSFKLPYVDENGKEKTLSATYKGVVLIGWSSSCGCATVNLPFIHGAWTFADKLGYEAKSGTKTVTKYISVKRGDVIQTDVTTME